MAEVFSQRDQQKVEYTVFRVDLRRAKGIQVHIDPELAQVAVYATQPIPPQYLAPI
jgi:hypothetical protein